MQRTKREVEASLRQKGFQAEETHHSMFTYYTSEGLRSTVRTRTSHGTSTKSLGDSLLALMAKQCKLSKKKFLELVDCTLDQAAYEKHLTETGDL